VIHALTQATLVVLTGMYAVRASWFLFSGVLSPLTPVAVACVTACVYLFHRAPTQPGTYLWAVMIGCVIGAIANAVLLTSADPAYRNATNLMFSGLSTVLWLALAALLWLSATASGATR
jgi:glucose uptake protein GlcU